MARAKGEGSVTKLPNGRWRARVRKNGRSASAERATKREAAAELPRLRDKLGVIITGQDVTVEMWMNRWMADAELADESVRLYRRMIDHHIVPRLGDLPIGEVDTPTIQQTYQSLRAAGVGSATIGRVHSVLSVAMAEAARQGLVRINPTHDAKPPKHTPRPPRPLSPDEAREVLAVCRTPDAPSGRIIASILLLGLRVNEATALRWEHVDLDGGWLEVPGTKTKASTATLPLAPLVVDVLGDPGPADAPVFPGRDGRPTSRQTVHRHWHSLQDALSITPQRRVHDLRHSTGSLLATWGVDQRFIQAILRHTDASMSVHYSRPHDPALRAALDKLADGLS